MQDLVKKENAKKLFLKKCQMYYKNIKTNNYIDRKRYIQNEDDIMVCQCKKGCDFNNSQQDGQEYSFDCDYKCVNRAI